MLVLSRKAGEAVLIAPAIRVTVLGVSGRRVRLGITAPPEVPVRREDPGRPVRGLAPPCPVRRVSQLRRKETMADLKKLKDEVLADGRIDEAEVALLRRELYADGQIDRDEAEFLVALRNEARAACPAFEGLFFEALKRNVLADGVIDAEEAAWLRGVLFADGVIDEAEKKFLRELKAEARQVGPGFQRLYDECLKK
jgi:hypothetical protein